MESKEEPPEDTIGGDTNAPSSMALPSAAHPTTSLFGPIQTAVLLLRNWGKFGVAERVVYHFQLLSSGSVSPSSVDEGSHHSASDLSMRRESSTTSILPSVSITSVPSHHSLLDSFGVQSILECVPTRPWHTLSRRQKRDFKRLLREFSGPDTVLPWPVSPHTRLYFAYEMTRVACVVDASATLTSTIGEDGSSFLCPLDRLAHMMRLFWKALAEAVVITATDSWQPALAVTVLAVGGSHSAPLVRDYRITDDATAERLCQRLDEWLLGCVEEELSRDRRPLADLIQAGQVALSTLSNVGRPLLVLATDGSSASSSSDMEGVLSSSDIPLVVLDASAPRTNRRNAEETDTTVETWRRLCHVTGGAYWNLPLLQAGAVTRAGQLDLDSVFYPDFYFAFRRHAIQPNAVQWYTLLQLSPLSPRVHEAWGQSPGTPRRRSLTELVDGTSTSTKPTERRASFVVPSLAPSESLVSLSESFRRRSLPGGTPSVVTATFSNYIINPIPIHEILIMRVKEGYCAKQYGQNMMDSDRLSIQFTLPVDMGILIKYELSYKSLPGQESNAMGFAHIKIELSGDAAWIALLKQDFLNHTNASVSESRPLSLVQEISSKLCRYLRWIRQEDLLQSYLSPPKWSDQLSSPTTPFIRRLSTLSSAQRRQHFTANELDCVCVGHMPWDDDGFLSEFRDTDDGSQQLLDAVQEWTDQTIIEGLRYIKQMQLDSGVAGYAVVSLVQSPLASRLFTVVLETFNGINAHTRQQICASLKSILQPLKAVQVLPKQFCNFLVLPNSQRRFSNDAPFSQIVLESHQNHATWDLVKDVELAPLLMKRRKEIGQFFLLESNDTSGFFARLFENEALSSHSDENPGNMAQYHFSILEEKVIVDFYMECESGIFFPFRQLQESKPTMFHVLVRSLKRRDQECGHALKCRTILLEAFSPTEPGLDTELISSRYLSSVQRLLGYASKVVLPLRFFQFDNDDANAALCDLTRDTLLSQSFGPKVAELPMSSDELVAGNLDDGLWFIVEYDKYTSSIVHLSNRNKSQLSEDSGNSSIFREMNFYTFSISDLYNRRDDVTDDDSMDDDHISEHLQVSEFSDSILVAHEQNFAVAAYLALQKQTVAVFDNKDFTEVLKTLEFVQIIEVSVNDEIEGPDHLSLHNFFDSVLYPVSSESDCFFYKSSPSDVTSLIKNEDSISQCDEPSLLEALDDDKSIESQISTKMEQQIVPGSVDLDQRRCGVTPPIFVRFLINDVAVSAGDLNRIVGTCTIAINISIFKENMSQSKITWRDEQFKLPSSHAAAATVLSSMLNAYVAELTLEKLRSRGRQLQGSDIMEAKSCMRNARNILSCAVNIFLYSAKSDLVVSASSQIEAGESVDEGFDFLLVELRKNSSLFLKAFKSIPGFLAELAESERTDHELPYWCFLNVHSSHGVVTVDICHPAGSDRASELMDSVVQSISNTCHRVNQLLMLSSLHTSRTASRLLIPIDEMSSNVMEDLVRTINNDNVFPDGHFECPIMYQTSFDLYHRCAANPMKAIRALEASILHIFAVSNRQQLFVYKDESGMIFYMRLVVQDSKSTKGIDLLVYGVERPGPSITEQLRNRLGKRLLLIAVEMLTSVLTKNPHYHWRLLDIIFIKSFQANWDVLDDSDSLGNVTSRNRTYAFPVSVFDPGMVAIIFRQNLCGSTYFHLLSTSELENEVSSEQEPFSVERNALRFESTDLLFYYNSSSSNLDPNLQSESTLTSKGAYYAKQTGSGLAIIEVSLLNCERKPMRTMNAAIPAVLAQNPDESSLSKLCFERVESDCSVTGLPVDVPAFVRVSVSDTSLQTDVLHEWILLCLNQALFGWTIERHLERMQKRLLFQPENRTNGIGMTDRKVNVDQVCLGLPALIEMIEHAEALPHPTALRMEFSGVLRSSSVASVARDLLESVILDQIRLETRITYGLDKHYKVLVIRSSRCSKPMLVELDKDSQGRALIRVVNDKRIHRAVYLSDAPTDCPEYSIFCYTPDYMDSGEATQSISFPKLFQEIAVGYSKSGDKGDYAKSLFDFKRRHLASFRRSFAFIFSVKRNQRILVSYNWSSLLFKRIGARLSETENLYLVSLAESVQSLQRRCLGLLAPISNVIVPTHQESERKDAAQAKSKQSEISRNESDRPSESQPSSHPPTIRRPKLVGKSVEGSALHAVAKSRARASASRHMRGLSQSSSVVTQKLPINMAEEQKSSSVRMQENPSTDQANRAESGSVSLKHYDDDIFIVHKLLDKSLNQHVYQSISRNSVFQKVTKEHWPSKTTNGTSQSLADYLFYLGSPNWTDSCLMVPFPKSMSEDFLLSFGQTLASWTPGFSLIRKQDLATRTQNCIFLVGKTRVLRNCRAFVAVRISAVTTRRKRIRTSVVVLECRTFTLPKHNIPKNKAHVMDSQMKLENGSAGLDKLSADIGKLFTLQGLLLDHTAFIVERTMKSVSRSEEYNNVVCILKPLVDLFPLDKVMRTIRSNYKCYKASIVLSSYSDFMINQFNSRELYEWMSSNLESTNLISCGSSGLCFKRIITVGVSQSICFLNFEDAFPEKMYMIILCRTQGMNIYDFMFRQGSNTAMSILSNIAIEAAGFAYVAIKSAAVNLRRDSLWTSFLPPTNVASPSLPYSQVAELLELCSVTPLVSLLDSNDDSMRLLEVFHDSSLLNHSRLCFCLARDPAFSLVWEVIDENTAENRYLFYFRPKELFLMIYTGMDSGLHLDLIEKHKRRSIDARNNGIVQMISNFVIHFLWSEASQFDQ